MDSLSPPQQLKVSPSDGRDRDLVPGKSFNMKIRGDPGSKVGLVAIDNAVYLLNKDKLTQSKVCVQEAERREKNGQINLNGFRLSPTLFRSGTLWRRETLAALTEGEKMQSRSSGMPGCCLTLVVASKPKSDRVSRPSKLT